MTGYIDDDVRPGAKAGVPVNPETDDSAATFPLDVNDPDDLMRLFRRTMGRFDLTDGLAALEETIGHSLALRRELPWTSELPDDIFLHYVVWPRVNNERLVPCRRRIHDELAGRIDGLDMERAAIEANYWCAEHVTYSPTDGRTISPYGALNRGIGRCGEESTLLVTVLRSIGIPARQIYTPRWAHCDDNHAWVEARIDGVWRFMGACEPEERLDRGWFDRAATRAMLVHSRVFCDCSCGNVNVSRSAGGTEHELLENVTANYAPLTTLAVHVETGSGVETAPDADGQRPATGATVAFELLNSAEYWPIAVTRCDENGDTSLQLGRGSVRVHASFVDRCADAIVDTSVTSSVTLRLGESIDGAQTYCGAPTPEEPPVWDDYDLVAPPSNASRAQTLTDEERRIGAARAAEAESKRVARLRGFEQASHTGVPERDAVLAKAGANWTVLARFLDADGSPDRIRLLQALNDKDLADVTFGQLDDAYAGAQTVRSGGMIDARSDMWRDYVLNPRVGTEELTEHRVSVQHGLDERIRRRFRTDPGEIIPWLAALDDDTAAAFGLPLDIGAQSLRRDIAFVRICRALGIPARLDPETREPQYALDGRFVDVRGGRSETNRPDDGPDDGKTATLVLESGDHDAPGYWVDWSLGRLTDTDHGHDYTSLDLSERPWDGGTMTVPLAAGRYRLITTTRLPNGNQQAKECHFVLHEGDGATIKLEWRTPREDELLEHVELEPMRLFDTAGNGYDLKDLVGDRRTVLFILDAHGSEPSIHVLDEMRLHLERMAERPGGYGDDPMFLFAVCPETDRPADAVMSQWNRMPVSFPLYGCSATATERLARITFVDPEKLPVIVAIRPERDTPVGVYACSGYSVGSVELAVRLAML